ncbi:RraA family protein [Thermosynechococcus sp. QKsg1]|uniref:RraA family protein n=1 Tax=Thermosynechococcus sp. QKsg1 TaxID=3074130 RepID=UPI002877C2DE|nr:RraA family protein [Thermosynechococcus sp. QKsg1]WNC86855.1 RraA family protein [Thermosynechococcus sp. QKsg1]
MNDSSVVLEVINIIERNRISTSQVSDALNKAGVLNNFRPLVYGYHKVGLVSYVYTHSNSNYHLHQQIENVPEGSIVYIEGFNCEGKALFGELVAKYLLLYKRCKAIIVGGLVRDVHSLLKERYPIWSFGTTPIGCSNSLPEPNDYVNEQVNQSRARFENAIIVADDSGVVLIEKEKINESLKQRLQFVELQEDIWFYCIDTLKWSTYETICRKSYMNNPLVLPANLQAKLKEVMPDESE